MYERRPGDSGRRFVRRLSCRLSVPETSLRLWQGITLPHLTQQRALLYMLILIEDLQVW